MQPSAYVSGPGPRGRGGAAPGPWSRRQFLKAAAIGGFAAPFVISCQTPKLVREANGKLNHACIGVGGSGGVDLLGFAQDPRVEIVALCDVDADALANAASVSSGARQYADWRELLQKEGNQLDSVSISVPDHMHFAIAWSAIQQAKHVYCRTPLCHDVAELRALTAAAQARNVVTQVDTGTDFSGNEPQALRWLEEGRIGKLTHAYLCSNGPASRDETVRLRGPRPAVTQPPPPTLKWDWWLGTAPARPYAPDLYHPKRWRAWQDFGTGWLGEGGCQLFGAIWKGLELQPPLTIRAEVQDSWRNSSERRVDTWPQWCHVSWLLPANKKVLGQELMLEWFDDDYEAPDQVRALVSPDATAFPPECVLLVGTEGSLLIPHSPLPPRLLPAAKFKDVPSASGAPRELIPEFVTACFSRKQTANSFEQVAPRTEAVLLGTVAVRLPGKTLEWDSARLGFKNDPQANDYLRRRYRSGWHVAQF
jgi:hypothetical protein